MMARGLDNKPHTSYQLQLVQWNEVGSMKKSKIVKAVSLLKASPSYEFIIVKMTLGALWVSSQGHVALHLSKSS